MWSAFSSPACSFSPFFSSMSSRLLRIGSFALLLPAACWLIPPSEAKAQLLRRGADRGRAGILGGRFDPRLGRPNPAPVPNAVNPAAAGSSAARANGGIPPGPLGPVAAPRLGGVPANAASARSSLYGAANAAPLNRLPYAGPGVSVRLPADLQGEVNYLIDGSEHLVIHPGEQQQLRTKGSYDVRFSRGITDDGRSFGEANYTITEGVYRFAVTENGWELYREADATAAPASTPESQLQLAAPKASSSQEDVLPAPHPRSILER